MVNIRMSSTVRRELLARWDEYRIERHRQELELEKATGGHQSDIDDHFARGGTPLITFKDWLKGQQGSGVPDGWEPDPDFVHEPLGDPDEKPPF